MEEKLKRFNFNGRKKSWDKFKDICKKNDSDASKEIRKFIERYIKNYEETKKKIMCRTEK